jgi:hypothetical protein
MEGTHLLLSLLWEAEYKVSREKAQICQNTVKYLGFHLPQGQHRLSPERKQAVCSIPALRPTGKSENFWKLQVSVESGNLTTPSWTNPSMKQQSGENGSIWYGPGNKRKPLKKSRRHSSMPLLWACHM